MRQGAIPKVFKNENIPAYISKPETAHRQTEASTSSARLELENERIQDSIEEHFEAEKFKNLAELDEKLQPDRAFLPKGIKEEKEEDQHIFYKLKIFNGKPPMVVYTIVIFEDLSFKMYFGEISLPVTKVIHLLATPGKIGSIDEVKNVIAYVNSLDAQSDVVKNAEIDDAINVLLKIKNLADDDKEKKLEFLIDQLKLIFYEHRYSPSTLATAMLWQNSSPALYRYVL